MRERERERKKERKRERKKERKSERERERENRIPLKDFAFVQFSLYFGQLVGL